MSWEFSKNTTTVEIQNPDPDETDIDQSNQVLMRSADGTPWVYDKGSTRRTIEATWSNLRDDELSDLRGFFKNQADRMANTFTLVDHLGRTWTARFIEPNLEAQAVGDQRASSSTFSTSGGGPYPTTQREDAAYNLTLKLEIQ